MRRGRRLAIDFGDVRIGVASCDPDATMAFPVTTVPAGKGELDAIAALVVEYEPIEVVVGLPRRLAGDEGPAAAYVRGRADALADALAERGLAVPLRLVDERLSTVTASRRLHDGGKNTRQQRAVIDAAAAVTILEAALTAEDAQGRPPGDVVSGTVPVGPATPTGPAADPAVVPVPEQEAPPA